MVTLYNLTNTFEHSQSIQLSFVFNIAWEHWPLLNKLHGLMFYKIDVTCVPKGQKSYII